MSHVLIVDSDLIHIAELRDALQAFHYRVTACSDQRRAIDAVRTQLVDLVVMVSASTTGWKAEAELFRDLVRQLPNSPQILCVLRKPYNGPSDRLDGDRLGITVIYER